MDKQTVASDLAFPMGDHAAGLSKREYIASTLFAAQIQRDRVSDLAASAELAVHAADALIDALNK